MANEPQFTIDPLTQREELDDVATAEAWVAALEEQGILGDPMRVVWLRMLGRLDEAAALGWQVLARSGGPASSEHIDTADLPLTGVAAAIRLAHVLQWQGDFELAHALFDCAIATIEAVPPLHEDTAYADYLRPFAYQHRARCYFDQEDYAKALELAETALQLRQDAGVPEDQILHSAGLINAARSRLAADAELTA